MNVAKSGIVGLPTIGYIVLASIVAVTILILISPYVGFTKPDIADRIIYKLKELFMLKIPDTLVIYHFEEGSGASEIEDHSWHRNTGKPENAAIVTNEAFIGNGSIKFGGEGSYIRIPTLNDYNTIKNGIGVDFWIKLSSTPYSETPIVNLSFFKVILNETGHLKAKIYLIDGWYEWSSRKTIGDSWTYVAVTYDGDAGEGRIIINDAIEGTLHTSKNLFSSYCHPIYVQETEVTIGNFDGWLDEFRLYNRPLPTGETAMHFQALY